MSTAKQAIRMLIHHLGYDLRRLPKTSPVSGRPPSVEGKLKLPSVPFRSVVTGDVKIHILEIDQANGNVSLPELVVINTFVARRQAKILFEIGTFDGRTTMNMAANSVSAGTVYTLDLPRNEMNSVALRLEQNDTQYVDKDRSGIRYRGTGWEKTIVQLCGDSAKFDYAPYQGRVDLIFIDGSHSYEYVKNDTEIALKLASDSAVILWHDYHPFWSGVVRYLEEVHAKGGLFHGLRHIHDTSLVFLELNE